MGLFVVEGDLLSGEYQTIAHQCNCISKNGGGLYLDVIEKYPQTDVYSTRKRPSIPGTIMFINPVILMFSQYYPSGPREESFGFDTKEERECWFKQCLDAIPELGISEIAFPYKIGCGLAQGKWRKYKTMIKIFAKTNPDIDVYIVKKVD